MENLKVKSISLKSGIKIELYENKNNKPCAKALRVAKGGNVKCVFNYYFGTEQSRESYVKEYVEKIVKQEQEKANIKEAKKEALKNMNHNYSVGQVLYQSWGYEQTNIDFYQIIEIGAKSIKIRKINGEIISRHRGDYGYIKPIVDSFAGEVQLKKIQVSINYKGVAEYYISDRFGSLGVYDGGENGVYCSWGY